MAHSIIITGFHTKAESSADGRIITAGRMGKAGCIIIIMAGSIMAPGIIITPGIIMANCVDTACNIVLAEPGRALH